MAVVMSSSFVIVGEISPRRRSAELSTRTRVRTQSLTRRQTLPHDGNGSFGNPKMSIDVVVLGGTVRDAAHSTLLAASVETEKPYPVASENISTAAHRIKIGRAHV